MRRLFNRNRIARRRGFTLLEMLVVLVIIGLIAGLVGPQLMGRVDTSKVTAAQTQVRMLKSALDTMRLDIGRYPGKEEGLDMLMTAPKEPRAGGALARSLSGRSALPLDPWGNPYQYSPDGNSVIFLASAPTVKPAAMESTPMSAFCRRLEQRRRNRPRPSEFGRAAEPRRIAGGAKDCSELKTARGFTLLEVVVVVFILGLTSAIVGPRLPKMMDRLGLHFEARDGRT